MANTQELPLDETVWAAPEFVREVGGIHTNTILPYFSHSHFFDATSNNATLTTQALYNQKLYPILQTREAFEGRLRTMQGLEFMVTHDPSENDTKHDHNGVWVIRKQNRRKRQGLQDEVTGINSYFIVGENIYMAPSIGNILSSRLLSTVTSLTKMLAAASALPNFTPAMGHTYLDPTNKNPTLGSSVQTTQTTEGATPLPSTAPPGSTPLPTTQESGSNSTKISHAASSKTPLSTTDADPQSSHILSTSFDLFLRYGGEYMDENPLVGEPGSFKLSKARESGLPPSSQLPTTSHQPFKAAAKKVAPVLELKTDVPPAGIEPGRKGSASAKSPITPGLKRKKERRKSKAAGGEEGGTPRTEGGG